MRKLGICWNGMEQQFEDLLSEQCIKVGSFRYLEIGVRRCETTMV